MKKDFLKIIVEHKKEEVAIAKKRLPENQLRDKALGSEKKRSFFDRFTNNNQAGVNIIAEIKRSSPSKGSIRPDLNPAEYARDYELGGASAISVLTDSKYFQGGFKDLITARGATSLPVLRKDFLISSYQVYESAFLGADAVLLIVRILLKEQLKKYLILCRELKLDALVEVHSEKDLESAAWAGAKLIGINNRNLSSFETDIRTAIRLVSLLEPDQIPVAASGIRNIDDIKQNMQFGINNFLIGESLVRSGNPKVFLETLTSVKI